MINKSNSSWCTKLSLLLAVAFPLGSASAQTELIFAEDVSVGKKGVNSTPRQAYPNSLAKGESFKRRLGGVDAVQFEDVAVDWSKAKKESGGSNYKL